MSSVALVLGDQLWPDNPALRAIRRGEDTVLMIEAPGESTHVWSHKARIVMFLAAMRGFARELERAGHRMRYVRLADHSENGLDERLAAELGTLEATRLHLCEPGDWRLREALRTACAGAGVALEEHADTHFLIGTADFQRWAGRGKQLRMEHFYRFMRRRTGILMTGPDADEPEGGVWNFDHDNRSAYPKTGPGNIPPRRSFTPDALTREVIAEVEARFPGHPGELRDFDWPVTRAKALEALDDFIRHRLVNFGRYQDAMWTATPFGWHAQISAAMNLRLLDPREVIDTVLAAYREQRLPLPAVEGFIRQVLGWREFIRGVYWMDMPEMAEANHFGHQRALPAWYWTGRTDMACMRDTIGQTLELGYAHHIQRLMLTGNFALIAGVDPAAVCDWYLAVYVDAVDWVERPNTAGMALYANGGRFTSKPYAASGAYVRRMSNYCGGCRYRNEARTGDDACPFNVFFWDFLGRHDMELAANPRTALMAKNLARLDRGERMAIARQAERHAARMDAL